jgi:hypothetical protein
VRAKAVTHHHRGARRQSWVTPQGRTRDLSVSIREGQFAGTWPPAGIDRLVGLGLYDLVAASMAMTASGALRRQLSGYTAGQASDNRNQDDVLLHV